METLLPILLPTIAGAVGGNIGGRVVKNASLGTKVNTIVGAGGGLITSNVLGTLAPALGAGLADSGFNLGGIVASGVGGILLQILVGLIQRRVAS